MKRAPLVGLFSSLLLCCAASLPAPDPRHVLAARERDPGVMHEDLARGRSLYVAKCGSCHTLKSPHLLAPEAWQQEVEEMRAEQGVKLEAGEARAIVLYLGAVSAVARR